jgi:hypothetical protein
VWRKESHSIGSMQEGFKRHHSVQVAEFCPELGVRLSQGLSSLSEEPVPAERFGVPKGFTELFSDRQPEPRALLEGMLPEGYQLTTVKKLGNKVEETWERPGGSGNTILLEHCVFKTGAEAEKFARERWEIKSWDRDKFWHEPRFAAFLRGSHLVRISLFGHDDPDMPFKVARALAKKPLAIGARRGRETLERSG